MNYEIMQGDCLEVLRALPAGSVQCVVTSPPYYGLRDYGVAGQIGLEETPEAYVENLVAVFREVRRVLRDDGACWLNLGDSYNGSGGAGGDYAEGGLKEGQPKYPGRKVNGLKPKDLIGIPWRVAFALQADGWYLRSDIIWHKPNPMPESVTDRPTKSHEYLFLLTKNARYFYDAEAVAEPSTYPDDNRKARSSVDQKRMPTENIAGVRPGSATYPTRNRRSVWTISTKPFSGAKLMADYVGDDGKPYKASPDCPFHAHLAHAQKTYTGSSDGQLSLFAIRNDDTDSRPESSPVSLPTSRTSHNSQDEVGGNAPMQTTGNNHESKTSVDLPEYTSPSQNRSRTSRKSKSYDGEDCKTGSLPPTYSSIATDHNTQTNRTDRAHQIDQRGMPFAQTGSHIPNIELPSGLSEQGRGSGENNISEDALSDSPEYRNRDHIARTSDGQELSGSYQELYCTCSIVATDHFATYPPELVEPCIKAGTSERGCCPECGAPWERVTERQTKDVAPSEIDRYGNGQAGIHRKIGGQYQKFLDENPTVTTGWQPTCEHNAEPVPCLVLDPFNGSGTTGAVAVNLGRKYVGIELNPAYIELAHKRIGASPVPLFTEAG